MSEFADVYNSKKEKTGKVVERGKKEDVEKGEFIITVTCWIVNKEGKILLTQRRLDKYYGGKWEATSGLVTSGETSLQGAIRELSEEIGVNVKESEIELVKEFSEERENVGFFRDIYLVKKEISINDLNFKDGEVIDAKYVTKDEFEKMLIDGEAIGHLSYFTDLYEEVIK